jgi:formylglycine-generating enzyme
VTIDLEEVLASHGPDEPSRYIAIADHFLGRDDRPAAAAALDRAYGLAPDDPGLARHRAAILDELAVTEHGLVWRYIPAGSFVMGSDRGDPDERPMHPRRIGAFWMTNVPITWTAYCVLMGWSSPSESFPPESVPIDRLALGLRNDIRNQYSRAEPRDAYDWRAHVIGGPGEVARADSPALMRYAEKPMVAAVIEECDLLATRLTRNAFRVALPTEAQWEKAARGGLVGNRFSWGDEPASPERCDFGHFGAFHLVEPLSLPPNGYGLYGMCGGSGSGPAMTTTRSHIARRPRAAARR